MGILFNFVTYFLIVILDPLPDQLIFNFLNFIESIDSDIIIRIQNIDKALYQHEITIHYLFALGSFFGFTHFMISVYILIKGIKNPRVGYINLISSLIECILFGFTTSLPFFL